MKRNLPESVYYLCCLLIGLTLSINLAQAGSSKSTMSMGEAHQCAFDPNWVKDPSMPTEVAKSGMSNGKPDSTFCDFYQFSWQAFFYLVNNPGEEANFQNNALYPFLEALDESSCDKKIPPQKTLYFRTEKSHGIKSTQGRIPIRTGQAGSNSAVFDKNGNVVLYEVRFNKDLCNTAPDLKNKEEIPEGNLPVGTTEIKLAWRVLEGNHPENALYFTTKANVDDGKEKETLGLVGFHLAISTKDHPEMVWVTWEHRANVPNCDNPSSAFKAANGWSFLTKEGLSCLKDKNREQCFKKYDININQGEVIDNSKAPALKGSPSNICRVYPYGTADTDKSSEENVDDIKSLNKQMQAFMKDYKGGNISSVWQYYLNIGGLWESDVTKSSSDTRNQRGSFHLTNSVMETEEQGAAFPNENAVTTNCFGCHNYEPNKTAASGLSHIFTELKGSSKSHTSAVKELLNKTAQ